MRRWSVGILALGTLACAGGGGTSATVPALSSLPRTRAERTSYRETSLYADVMAFLDSLVASGAPVRKGSIGRTSEGRDVPYVIASRPPVATPEEARRLGRPVVYIQGNIHSGEVEGKEALQMILRDLVASPTPNVLDSLVFIAVPDYNADGNEKLAPQARNRGSQNGPEMVGTRPNAQGLNLNRDYMKAEAPETRGSLAMFNAWSPEVFVDLHTSNGSYHGYALTYSPSLLPLAEDPRAVSASVFTRDSMLPVIRRRMRERHRFETFDYGNFDSQDNPKEWRTYEHVPRFGTNYYGLRGRVSILSEAYSHDPFERRVKSTYAFVREILSFTAERRARIMALGREADARVTAWGNDPSRAPAVPIRAAMAQAPQPADVIWEEMERTTDTVQTEPGVRRGMRRTGRFRTSRMTVWDRFAPTRTRSLPWGYALQPQDTAAVALLRLHGVRVERVTASCPGGSAQFGPQFTDTTRVIAPTPFEGRRLVRLEGRWGERSGTVDLNGAHLIRTAQPLGLLAAYLLEPESDDGLVAWNVGQRVSEQSGLEKRVVRLAGPLPATCRTG